MTKIFIIILMTLGLAATSAFAGQQEFCDGFKEGFKTVKGNMVLVPLCPLKPLTPLGSTDFREGIKAGIEAANK